MNRDVLETQWPQVREIIRDKFSDLTEEDIRQINGRYDALVAKLQQKYGYTREEAEDRIRSWNFDRSLPRGQVLREDKMRDERARREEDSSSIWKWVLGLGIPLLLLGLYTLGADRTNDFTTTTSTTPANSQQVVIESPADRAISNNLRNFLVAQPNLANNMDDIRISTNNGVVTISGSVDSREMHDFLISRASNFAGVRQVVDNLQVK